MIWESRVDRLQGRSTRLLSGFAVNLTLKHIMDAKYLEERNAEYNRRHTARRKEQMEALRARAEAGDQEAQSQLAERKQYQVRATVKSYRKMRDDALSGDPIAKVRYEKTLAILSAGQCAVRNGSAFIPDEAVAGNGSTSNADRRICDFYDSAGGWQRGCIFGTGGSNDSASMVHIRR